MVKKFTVNEKEYEIREPSAKDIQEAQRHYNKVYATGLRDPDLLTRDQMIILMKERGIWDDNKEKNIEKKKEELFALEEKLEQGGIELEDAKKIAKKMMDLREEILLESTTVNTMLDHTIEQQAQNAYEDYILSCIVFHKNKKFCKNLDDYYAKGNDEVLISAYNEHKSVIKNIKETYGGLTEIKFLQDYGFMDEDFVLKEDIKNKKEKTKKEKKPFLKNGKPVEV